MENKWNLSFRRGDLLAIGLVIAVAAAVMLSCLPAAAGTGIEAQVYQEGRLIRRLSLDQDCTLEVSGAYTNTIAVQNGRISIADSDCPGRDCVHSGAISTPGRSIVCLPNRVEIRISGASTDVDFVVR